MRYEIKHKNGTLVATAQSLTYSSKRMGEEFVTVTLRSASPVDFEIGDYIAYRGVNYYLNVIPSVKKRSSRNSVGDAFVYDNVKFESVSTELVNCTFRDVVLSDNQLHTALPSFAFMTNTAADLADRIQANLNALNTGWSVVCTEAVRRGLEGKKNINISVDNINCWEALALVNSEFDVNFSVRGRTITIGKVENVLNAEAMRYGLGNGLVTIEKTTDENQQVITRLRAYGNTTNMPTRYYANIGVSCRLPINSDTILKYKPEWKDGVPTNAEAEYILSKKFDPSLVISIIKSGVAGEGEGCMFMTTSPYLQSLGQSCFNAYDSETSSAYFKDENGDEYIAVVTNKGEAPAGYPYYGSSVVFVKKGVDEDFFANKGTLVGLRGVSEDNWPVGIKTNPTTSMSPNFHVDHLMLPSFPTNQDPYLESDNISELGIREATVFFDGSNGLDDIYPTIENLDVSVVSASGFSDNGIFGTDTTSETVPPFTIQIAFGENTTPFDPWEQKIAGETAYISMKSGMCQGRQFEITGCKKIDDRTFELTCKREEEKAFSRYFPYNDYPITESDTFVLLGISMPDAYVTEAARKLEEAAQKYLEENSKVKYNYSLNLSSIFMQKMVDAGEDWHDTICAGQSLVFEDADIIGSDAISIPIESLEIKEGEDSLPKYTITLSDSTQVSTISKVQSEIKSVQNAALTTLFPLSIKNNGKLVGTYNPAIKGITIELATPENTGSGDSFFEEYDTGDTHMETRQKRDDEGNLLWLDADGNETTDDTGVPSNEEIEVNSISVRLKPQYVGLFSEGWISAYGLNPNGGSGGGGNSYNRLDRWEDYSDDKGIWVLSAKLGYELYSTINDSVVPQFEQKFAYIDSRLIEIDNKITNAGEKLTFTTSGDGNAVTGVEKVGTVVTLIKGVTFQENISDLANIRSNATNGATAYGWGNHANAGYFSASSFTKANIKSTLGISDWALKSALAFTDLPKMYWADQAVSSESSTQTTPTFKQITLSNGGKSMTLSIVDGNLKIDGSGGVYSTKFVSAYGLNAASQGGGVDVASQNWGDATYTASKAAPANLTASKINDLTDRIGALEGRKPVTSWNDLTDKPTIPTKHSDLTGDYVSTFGSKTGSITLLNGQTANGSVNLTMTNNQLGANVVGLKALAFKESLGKADVGLGNVENTALSTWVGSSNIKTVGTITSGTWQGGKIANEYLQNNKMTLWGNEVSLGGSADGSITIKNGTKAVILSVDADGNLKVDKGNTASGGGLYSTSFVSAYGKSNSSGGGANVASQTWGDSTYTASNAAPANLTASKINDVISRVEALEGKKVVTSWNDLTDKPKSLPANGGTSETYSGYTKAITINGDSDTFYPVYISGPADKTREHTISIWKNLGTKTASYPGNHQNNTSSLWVIYKGRHNGWDGNGGFWYTYYIKEPYSNLIEHAECPGGIMTGIIAWLRGGGTSYNVSCDLDISVTVYYDDNSNLSGNSTHTCVRSPMKSGGNGGNIGGIHHYGTSDSANYVAWGNVASKPSFATVATSGKYSDLTGTPTIPTTLPASDVYSWAKASTKPSYTASEVGALPKQSDAKDLQKWSGDDEWGFSQWATGTLNTPTTYGTSLNFRSLTTWYYRLAFGTDARIYHYSGINTTALTLRGTIAYLSDIPTTLPASDVYSWAKASTKPSYSWSEITGTVPTWNQNTTGTAAGITGYTFKTASEVSTSGWKDVTTDSKIIPTMSFMAYWNGAHSGTRSNLTYCAQGSIIGSSNIGSQSVNYANSAGSVAWTNVSSRPTKLSQFTDDVVSGNYLPLSGGTLSGSLKIENDLRLQKGSDAYGRTLRFGDGDYCYLKENTDDQLTIFADKGLLVGGTSALSKRVYFGDTSHYIELNASGFHFSHGIYSDSFISAYGKGSDSTFGSLVSQSLKTSSLCIESNSSGVYESARVGEINRYTGVLYLQHVSSHNTIICNGGGNVGINTTSPSYKLHVAGSAGGTSWTNTSDVRYKEKIEDVNIRVSDIASAPIFTFKWTNKKWGDKIELGSSAQYWQGIVSSAVNYDKENDVYGLNYQSLSLAACVALAKQSESHEERIKRLEDENRDLKKRILELERA